MRRDSMGKRLVAFLQKIGKVLLGILLFFIVVTVGQCCWQISRFAQATATPRLTATTAVTAAPDIRGTLVDLLEAGQIEARPRGSSIDELELDLKRLIDKPMEVEIEVGTYFVSHSGSVQNMVVLQEVVVRLDHDGWIEELLEVACANKRRQIPDAADTFDILRASEQPELQMLLESMDSSARESWGYQSYDVHQAAIWIVTDDATYIGLGTLVRGTGFEGFRSRAIDEDDAARAMQLVDDAGIDITTKAIWDDRETIAAGVEDPALAAWIRVREGQTER